VRKGGLEPPRFYPPDPKFLTSTKSISYTGSYPTLPNNTNGYLALAYGVVVALGNIQ